MSRCGEIVQTTDEYLLNALNNVVKQQFNIRRVSDMTMSHACGKADNYFGIIYRVKVSGIKDNGDVTKLSLILKIPPSATEETRDKLPIAKLFERDAFMYNVTLPSLCALQENKGIQENEKYWNISCYKTGIELNREFLIMQDGCSEKFVVPPRTMAFDNVHCSLILKQIAKFHALSFVKKEENPDEFNKFAKYTGGIDDFDKEDYIAVLDLLVIKFLNTVKNEQIKEILENYVANLYEKTLAYTKPEAAEGYAVLTHADCWTNNILIKYQNGSPIKCGFIDWQTLTCSSPIIDVSFIILSCTDEETRKQHLDNWLEHYYKCLTDHIKALGHDPDKLYPRKIYNRHIEKLFAFGLAMSFVMLPATVGGDADALSLDEVSSSEGRENMSKEFSTPEMAEKLGTRLEGIVRTCLEMKITM